MTDRRLLGAIVLALGTLSCRDASTVHVQLDAITRPGFSARQVEIRAQVSGPLEGLRYRWFSGAGEAIPQETEQPMTVFTFAEGTSRDRVSLDVLYDEKRVAHEEIDVEMDERRARAEALLPRVRVELTKIPPYDADGGPDTRATIAGKVTGGLTKQTRVLVYARADVWYIQPHPDSRHPIGDDGEWSTWTHTGSSYAVLVVGPGFYPLPRYDMLPPVGGSVLARLTVEGAKR